MGNAVSESIRPLSSKKPHRKRCRGLPAKERGKGRAIAAVNVDHDILKHMLKYGMKQDLLTRNVACLRSGTEAEECARSGTRAG